MIEEHELEPQLKAKELYDKLIHSSIHEPKYEVFDDGTVCGEILSICGTREKLELIEHGCFIYTGFISRLIKDPDVNVRLALVDNIEKIHETHPTYSQILSTDSDERVRLAMINKGYFVYAGHVDPSPIVRAAVAMKSYCSDILLHDQDELVRAAVIRSGYNVGIESFIEDPSSIVRAAVASMGVGLDILYKDPDPVVRAEVAKQGYAIGQLINDADSIVRASVIEYCVKKYN